MLIPIQKNVLQLVQNASSFQTAYEYMIINSFILIINKRIMRFSCLFSTCDIFTKTTIVACHKKQKNRKLLQPANAMIFKHNSLVSRYQKPLLLKAMLASKDVMVLLTLSVRIKKTTAIPYDIDTTSF